MKKQFNKKTFFAISIITILIASNIPLVVGNVYSSYTNGFESGDFSDWDGSWTSSGETAIVRTTNPLEGQYSAMFSSDGDGNTEGSVVYKDLSPSSEVYASAYVYVDTSGIVENMDRHYFITLRSPSTGLAWAGWFKVNGEVFWVLTIRDGSTYVSDFQGRPSTDKWYNVELKWVEDGTDGYAELWVDDNLQVSMHNKDTNNFGDATTVRFGLEQHYCRSTTIYVDSVIINVDSAIINDETGETDTSNTDTPNTTSGDYLFEAGFESGDFSDWDDTSMRIYINTQGIGGGAVTIDSTHAHTGKYSMKSEVWDPTLSRRAVLEVKGMEDFAGQAVGTVHWVYLPEDFDLRTDGITWNYYEFMALYAETLPNGATTYLKLSINQNFRTGSFSLYLGGRDETNSQYSFGSVSNFPLKRGEWFKVETFLVRDERNGAVKVWIDDQLIFDVSGVRTKYYDPYRVQIGKCYFNPSDSAHRMHWVDDFAIYTIS